MLLIDTSVWVGYLRRSETQEVFWLQQILDLEVPFGITPQIYQEVIQGADSEKSFKRLASFFGSQVFYLPQDPIEHARLAAQLYSRCRRRGFTIRSTIDCSIAQTAIDYDLMLLHADRDFDYLQTVAQELRIYQGRLRPHSGPSLIQEPRTPYDPDR